ETTMPNLVGKDVGEASKALRAKGLVLRVADRAYSDVPINQVLRQTPPPGMLMKVSQQAHVVLSLGQRELQIPPLEGNSLRVSRIELLRGGLQVGEVSSVTLPEHATDLVLQQNPKPGRGAATPRVDLLVTSPPKEQAYVMPYFMGLNEIDVQHRLDQANLHRKIDYVAAPQWPHGTVIDQTPLAGTRIGSNAEVGLTVAN
ncbi:MAG TPA: PASTA domain-containing protein, partial [Candidatus Acidoferrum sp.]|nr:PASTA domain-containing protein [Candidatus Acidoferrum sp.]